MRFTRLLLVLSLLAVPSTSLAWNSMTSSGNPLAWDSGNPETSWRLSSSFTSNDLTDGEGAPA